MSNPFFDHPILNSPYASPPRHWELDESGQPTQMILETRRRAEFITPIPKPKKRKTADPQVGLPFNAGTAISTKSQQYDITSTINCRRPVKGDGYCCHPPPSALYSCMTLWYSLPRACASVSSALNRERCPSRTSRKVAMPPR
jgi:hypothetical protein